MKLIADFHIHSAYARGCSKDLTLENIAKWCRYKGINLVSTGDFTHPAWFRSIKSELIGDGSGFYLLKSKTERTKFLIGAEISCVYMQGGRCRRVHICLLAPTIEAAEKLSTALIKRGCNLRSDGRPIIGMSAKALAELCWQIDPDFFVFPAHAWTPWYAVFGSKSGFDSLTECFEDLTQKITALETGLSSDPAMNHRLSMLDGIALLSNSDAHSLANLGREANVFELDESEMNFHDLTESIKGSAPNKFVSTIEFFPEEGKYHVDGHAACGYSCEPAESSRNRGLCPKCGKKLILGVLNRVSELADRKTVDAKSFRPESYLVPLMEIIAAAYGVGKQSKKVRAKYLELVEKYSEFSLLIDLEESLLVKIAGNRIAEGIINVRRGKISLTPGYDGIFGRVGIEFSNQSG